ncbi:MAG: hypothetical protein IT454_07120 [Planctomycetes bacterium]|nr:hypothetical protein [Planctomycetota bacterium]
MIQLPLSRLLALATLALLALPAATRGSAQPSCGCGGVTLDCNENGIEDALDIASGASADLDCDGVPDECERSR